ncbi:hypothetical protein ZEAMMB73_Zm00001d041234 [Zea mays]|uniref:Uncharacterized protein n=1 Tax=Zea mays TaxID=4577 RepID=A0A1D6NY96_MAIZE|nr:hypothetical protein ZEAMMB73_Zm00001d045683 [Zea mays]AQL02973.1 hypothetical protein ZEAMMB73_Zm00001d045684 [Zea mays]ONM02872.1 hypothetical protein ZEAMMB73_Zm00001d031442 [Zea mays]ONM32711.1 hypothetical protein ZEAMMB73_Zm00001d041234 [Zea mays]
MTQILQELKDQTCAQDLNEIGLRLRRKECLMICI